MDAIKELLNINFSYVLISVFVILIGIKAFVSIFEWVIDKMGLETKWMRQKREEHELLIQTSQNLASLQEKHEKDIESSDRRDEEIASDIKKLTQMFVDKEIDDMRWEINNFATKVSEGKPCNKDSFKHCIHMYEKYERILEDNGLENGEVEISMELINEAYKEKLKEGF
jgi:ribosomal protein S15P/S13E